MLPTKIALVTGGSSGIGRATCLALAQDGYRIVVVGTKTQSVQETVDLINFSTIRSDYSSHLGLTLDVTCEEDMQAMASKTVEYFGRIDLLVASAGVGKKPDSGRLMPYSTASLPLEEWNFVLNVNLCGVFLSNRAVLPIMIAQRAGTIINICSSTTPRGLRGQPYAPAYCASKSAVVGLTESLAEEVRPYGIRVQALFPGYVKTPLVSETALHHRYGGSMNPETLAAVITYLARQDSDVRVVHPHVIPLASLINKS